MKNKYKGGCDGDAVLKKVGRPNILDKHLIRKRKDIALELDKLMEPVTKDKFETLLKVLLGQIILTCWKSLVELWN